MKGKTSSILAFLAVLLAFPTIGRAQFVMSGELRPRAEFRHGYKAPAFDGMTPAAFISQRSRINLNYKDEKMKAGISLQDVRVWGNVTQMNVSDNNFSVHEAWGEYFFTPTLSFKAGRMELVYDDSRMLGNVDWAQQARSHDIGLLKWQPGTWKIHGGLAFNQDKERLDDRLYYVAGNYKSMQMLWINHSWEILEMSLLALNTGNHNRLENGQVVVYDTRFTQTLGGTGTLKVHPVTLNASFYKQTGKDVPDIKVDAMMYSANAKLDLSKALSITAGIENLSGTSQKNASPNVTNSFNPLFGTNHKFNGHMDYYYVGNHINSVGLQDVFVKLNFGKGIVSLGTDLHLFSAAADIVDPKNPGNVMSKNLGQEIDAYLAIKLAGNVTLNAGYSQYLPTASVIALKGGSQDMTSYWAWASLTFKPTFFEH